VLERGRGGAVDGRAAGMHNSIAGMAGEFFLMLGSANPASTNASDDPDDASSVEANGTGPSDEDSKPSSESLIGGASAPPFDICADCGCRRNRLRSLLFSSDPDCYAVCCTA